MVDARVFTGGLNQDTADELLPSGDYRSALNIDPGSSGITKLLGNVGLNSLPATPSGTNWVCGSHFDKTRQKVFYFVFNSANYHRIVSVNIDSVNPNLSTSTILFEDRTDTGGTSIFGWSNGETSFSPLKMIKDIKIIYRGTGEEGDLVYFIDPLKRPLKFNTVELPVLASTNDVLFDYFKVIKAPPTSQPICNYVDLTTRKINNLRKKLFAFKYRYIYNDDEKSVWSAISKMSLPPKSNDESYYADGTKANGITINVFSGNKTIKKIEIAARINIDSVWGNFFLVDTINKSSLSISDNSTYQYLFLNDGSYLPLEIEESNLLFDYVPDEANALELANGNTLVFGGIKEGRSRVSSPNMSVVAIESQSVSSPTYQTYNNSIALPNDFFYKRATTITIDIQGAVNVGDVFTFDFKNISEPLLSSVIQNTDIGNPWSSWVRVSEPSINYTVLAGQTDYNDFLVALVNAINASSTIINASINYLIAPNFSPKGIILEITDPNYSFLTYGTLDIYGQDGKGVYISFTPSGTISGLSDSKPALKWMGRYKYGIAYYDSDGKTNGVYSTKDTVFDVPKYNEISGSATTSKVRLSISHLPPSWASYYHIVRTNELTSSFSKFIITKGVDITDAVNGPPKSGFVYINIQNLQLHAEKNPSSASIINYTSTSFVKGDRVRFIKNHSSGVIFTDSLDYEIIGVVSRGTTPNVEQYLKIAYVDGMPSFANVSGNQPEFLVEIYRPSPNISSENNFYYEIGDRFTIGIDGLNNRVHLGNVQNQNTFLFVSPAILDVEGGDYYIRQRELVVDSDTQLGRVTYTCMDANFSDFWESAVWGQGRALVIDEAAKSQYFPALIRFSQSFIQGTNINNLNRFYPENFEEADNSFGDILRLKTRENFIRMFQRYKVGMIPIYRSIIVDTANSTQVGISEKLLNAPNYYAGEYGIDKYGSSLVSTDYGDYFIDSINRAIVRVSLDGMTNISDTYNMSTYANSQIGQNSYGYGYFNYETRSVVVLIGNIGQTASIISYSESRKSFESLHGYTDSTSFQFVNGFLWSFYGKPYVHNQSVRNNFYGVQQQCNISTIFNQNVQLKKTYMAIELLSTEIWNSAMQTGPLLNQQTTIDAVDYTKTTGAYSIQNKENKYNATIKRDMTVSGNKYFGDTMKGNFAQLTLSNSTNLESKLISVSLKYIQSPLTNM
jgi:hypothetical protein